MTRRVLSTTLLLVLLAAALSIPASATTCTVSNVFGALSGTVAVSLIDDNFTSVLNCINALDTRVTTLETTVAGIPTTPPRSYLVGMTLARVNATTFSAAAGQATDSTQTTNMVLAASISKTTAGWAVGSGNGGLDTGAIGASTWYHAFVIRRSDTGVVDVLFSLSATAPTMPASYNAKRRIGSLKTNASSQWIDFVQTSCFRWKASLADVNGVPGVTTAESKTLTVPTGVQVDAMVNLELSYAGTPGANIYFLVSDLAANDESPTSIGQVATPVMFNPVANVGTTLIRTNTSAQVRTRVTDAGAAIRVQTFGWCDRLGRDD